MRRHHHNHSPRNPDRVAPWVFVVLVVLAVAVVALVVYVLVH